MYVVNGLGKSYKRGVIYLHPDLAFISYISDFKSVDGIVNIFWSRAESRIASSNI